MEPFELPSDSSARHRVLAPDLEPDVNCAAAVGVPVLISAGADVAEWLARLIHDRSDRKSDPFVVFRPGRRNQLGLLKSVLDGWGPERGTLFVADVARAGSDVQALLRDMLGAPQPDPRAPFRIMAGTPVWLYERVERGEFDELLFYRLNKIHIRASSASPSNKAAGVRPGPASDQPDDRDGASSGSSRRSDQLPGHRAERGQKLPRDRSGTPGADRMVVDGHDRGHLARRARDERLVGP